jgi:uncharacterized membrane protein
MLIVICEVAFIFIERNINVLVDKVRSHFPTFVFVDIIINMPFKSIYGTNGPNPVDDRLI